MKRLTLNILFVCVSIISAQNLEKITIHLDNISVNDICSDGYNIWVASNGNGIFKYSLKNKKWENFSTANGSLSLDFFYSVDAGEEAVWAGSTDGLFILDKKQNRWTKRKFGKGGQLGNWIRSIKYDPKDEVVWIGRFMYLTKYEIRERRFTDYDLTIKGDEKTNTIKVIEVDGDSLVWFGTENGLHKYDKSRDLGEPGTVKFYNNRLNYFVGSGDAVSISTLLLERNNVWIGTDEFKSKTNPNYNTGGLYAYDRRNDWYRFDMNQGLRGNGIFDIERTGNFIWVSLYQFSMENNEVYGRGLAIINRLTQEVNVIEDKNLPATVYCIHFDGSYIWLGSNDGIYQIDLTNSFISGFPGR